MTDDNFNPSPLDSLKRYVPLAVWAIVIIVILADSVEDHQLWLSADGDDALRHAARR
jgi:hypothetical protein